MNAVAALQLSAVCGSADEPSRPAVSSWLMPAAEYRFRVEGFQGGRFQPGNDDTYALNRLRFGVTVRPMDSWRAIVQLQDSRVFLESERPPRAPQQHALDARLAYVEIGSGTTSGLTARVGRQELTFGDQRLIGNADWLNTGRTFDGVRAAWHRDRSSVDAFAVYPLSVRSDRINRPDPGNILFGTYAVMPAMVPAFTIDAYFFGRRAPHQFTESGASAILHSGTAGARWKSKSFRGVDTGGEVAGQFGSAGDNRLHAWAGHWEIGYTPGQLPLQPRFTGEYNFASGDRNRSDGRRETFDQLFPTGHDKYGLSDQVGWKNIHHLRQGVELHPASKWQMQVRYHSWWLASGADALYDASGAVIALPADAAAGRHVGQEIDVQAAFSGSRTLNVGGGYAHIFPGAFLEAATPGHSYSHPYVSLNVGF